MNGNISGSCSCSFTCSDCWTFSFVFNIQRQNDDGWNGIRWKLIAKSSSHRLHLIFISPENAEDGRKQQQQLLHPCYKHFQTLSCSFCADPSFCLVCYIAIFTTNGWFLQLDACIFGVLFSMIKSLIDILAGDISTFHLSVVCASVCCRSLNLSAA